MYVCVCVCVRGGQSTLCASGTHAWAVASACKLGRDVMREALAHPSLSPHELVSPCAGCANHFGKVARRTPSIASGIVH